ncbi:iron ABC transporter permease [Paenibacillus polymyxa]|jgi:ABC-type Fe3+-siderophore transport system permease subunit|uniref:FecCD family ABC transporter permease n=1 Tax=Paenibacillus polymyxa TaxID=1406 RepID=UPI001580AD89|nr:iron ABC transporter permease [Paenibacillus polymyxa]MBY0022041.1 iron ABC transporter permease [Paenibacillus polymyxa]MBY0057884.1 iron ABC transporter permease [Paenibacillus polymyxa]MBY0068497.1 iron ABC transporter permease [Paenibacillus polymyxa]MBY0079064.1 iron ABC transporter permease [Paenibacillus polymyxa]MBZ6443654.1 iron ABC transporter permease [Paenibacillus polymyxa]
MTRPFYLAAALLLLLLLGIVSVSVGALPIPLRDVSSALMDTHSRFHFIVYEVRLPRTLVGLLAGMGLAVAGAILQSLIRNPLASPDVIGISKGAGFAAAAVIFLFPQSPAYILPLAAFGGAVGTFLILLLLSRRLTLAPAALALVGVAMGAVLMAATQYLIVTHPTNVNTALLWMSGSLWGRSWREVISLLPWIIVLLPLVWGSYQKLNVYQLGDETITSLGVHMTRQRLLLLLLAVTLAGISVSAVGAIGFIGLMAPHMARRFVGSHNQWLIPLAALLGANLMLLGDILGRMLIVPREIPVGIMTALVGAPYFVYLLRKERSRRSF